MNKETFNKIKETLEMRIVRCGIYFDKVKITDDLKKLTIEQAQMLQRFCKQEETEMTKFVQNDLYHLIGMGELTPPQMMKLTFLTKDWLQYRGAIKAIAMNFDKISQLPNIPVTAAYKLKLCDLTLFTGPNVSSETVITELPYELSGSIIKISQNRTAEFINFWHLKSKANLSENNFMSKAKAGSEYGGIKWSVDPQGDYIGIIKDVNVRCLFEGCMKAAQENN